MRKEIVHVQLPRLFCGTPTPEMTGCFRGSTKNCCPPRFDGIFKKIRITENLNRLNQQASDVILLRHVSDEEIEISHDTA